MIDPSLRRELETLVRGALSTALRFDDTTESARCRPVGDVTLHRFTLSVRFIMALCTKPPIPFVGETGRAGEVRPSGDGGLAAFISNGYSILEGSSFCASESVRGDPSLPVKAGELGCGDEFDDDHLDPSAAASRDIPGNCVRFDGISAKSGSSTWFLR